MSEEISRGIFFEGVDGEGQRKRKRGKREGKREKGKEKKKS